MANSHPSQRVETRDYNESLSVFNECPYLALRSSQHKRQKKGFITYKKINPTKILDNGVEMAFDPKRWTKGKMYS
jgi:hypothetical protein